MDIYRGDICYVNFIKTTGSVQSGERPAVVTSNNKYNMFAPTIQVAPITSVFKHSPVHVEIGIEYGLDLPSVILIEQETTISKTQIIDRIGVCDDKKIKEIEIAIQKQKGIIEPFNISKCKVIIAAIIESEKILRKHKINKKETTFQYVLIKQLESYCNQYGINYKDILGKYISKNRKYQQEGNYKEVAY